MLGSTNFVIAASMPLEAAGIRSASNNQSRSSYFSSTAASLKGVNIGRGIDCAYQLIIVAANAPTGFKLSSCHTYPAFLTVLSLS